MTRTRRMRALLAGAVVLAGALAATPLKAQVSEEAVKSAFVAKFARYVTWPPTARPGAGRPFQLCVIGQDPYGATLDRAAANETIDGRGMAVKRLRSANGAAGCHLALVQGASDGETRQLLGAMERRPVLTITDSRAGSARGMIHFVVRDGRVRFFIDDAEAASRGLSVSSRLLALAAGVRRQRGP